jgi:formylmethanofuran dehydrogenase subunit E-like metal-binding protein
MRQAAFHVFRILIMLLLVTGQATATAPNYESARELGRAAAMQAADMLGTPWEGRQAIVLTNAGSARPGGLSSRGCLDGVGELTGASQGKATLLPLQSRFDQALWFAFYSPASGRCAYLQAESMAAARALSAQKQPAGEVFSLRQVARIEADFILGNIETFQARAQQGLFGENLFRVVTVANAAAEGCPDDLLRAVQVHDHYCPGVTSGLLLARFVQKDLLATAPERQCFVLGLQPWCKEDALITLLNATPGKRSYGVVYPKEDDPATWPAPLDATSTVVFTRSGSEQWQGWMLRFDFDKAKSMFDNPDSGSTVVDKLAMDLWFMNFLDRPEVFVSLLKTVRLPEGSSPKDLLRPGVDPVARLAGMLDKADGSGQ